MNCISIGDYIVMLSTVKKYSKNFIYIIFSIYIITILLQNTSIYRIESILENIVKIVRYCCYFIFIIKIFLDWKNGKSKITLIMIGITILSIIIYYFSKNKKLLILTILLCSLRNTNKDKLIEVGLKTYIIVFFMIVISSLLNLIPDWTYPKEQILRHSLGFYYPTITIAFYLMIVLMYVYLRKNKITIYEIIILQTLNVFLYKYTDGRTSFILATIILVFVLLKKISIINTILKNNIFKYILKICCYILPVLSLTFILLMVYLYGINNSFSYRLDDILSNRIELSYEALKEYKITLFGQQIQWKGWGGIGYDENINLKGYTYNFVDNSYVRLILDCGVIFTVLVIVGYTSILIKNYKSSNYWNILIIFVILCIAEIEPCLVDFNSNIFLIWFIPLIEYKPIRKLDYSNINKHR